MAQRLPSRLSIANTTDRCGFDARAGTMLVGLGLLPLDNTICGAWRSRFEVPALAPIGGNTVNAA